MNNNVHDIENYFSYEGVGPRGEWTINVCRFGHTEVGHELGDYVTYEDFVSIWLEYQPEGPDLDGRHFSQITLDGSDAEELATLFKPDLWAAIESREWELE